MGEQASGSNARIIIGAAETAFGVTPVTPAGLVLPFTSEGLGQKTELNKSNVIRSSRNASRPSRGNRDVSGNIATELNVNMGRLFKAAFGGITTVGAAAPYTHTFKIGALNSFPIEKGFTDLGSYFLYNGCKVNKFGFEVNPSGILPLDIDWVGASRTKGVATFDATAVDLGHNPFEGFDGAIKEAGVDIATITAFKWAVENNLDNSVYVLGSQGKRYRIPEGATVVSGSLTALFDSQTLLDKAIAGTETSIEVNLTKGTGAGTAGNESLQLLFDELIYQEQDPVIKDTKGILIELPWTAYWDNGANGTSVQAVLKNTQATL